MWREFSFQQMFKYIQQGRRLKKEDQISGDIPFVMAGTTNTGVANYVSNPVAQFPKNAITMDIFGNAFYRSYAFGAGDDTGVYWNPPENEYSREIMLFLTTAMSKSVFKKFSYGKKLRSSQSLKIKMKLLATPDGQPDFDTMQTLISAVQKQVIKDVVKYTEQKMAESH
ncbi:restriction endonuclease subunit S [Gallibacterium anatis]|nr:restriction endonuclease subunit S [Gallibacterium anatis]